MSLKEISPTTLMMVTNWIGGILANSFFLGAWPVMIDEFVEYLNKK